MASAPAAATAGTAPAAAPLVRTHRISPAGPGDAMSSTTAVQAIPSARPSAPSPSARVAFTFTGAPSTWPSRSAIRSTNGASFGRSATTVQSALTGTQPAARGQHHHRARITMLSAPLQRGIGVRGVAAQVAEAGRTEHGVGDGVGHGIGVAVPVQAPRPVPGHGDPAQHQRAVGPVGEPVDVDPLTDPKRGTRALALPFVALAAHRWAPASRASARPRSSGRVSFRFLGSPGHRAHREPQLLDQAGVVGGLAPEAVGLPQHGGGEGLGRLHRHQLRPVDGGDHLAVGDPLQRVGHRQHRDGASGGASLHGPDHRREQGGVDQRAGRIVDHDHLGLVGYRRQSGPDRVGPGRTAGHHPVSSARLGLVVMVRTRRWIGTGVFLLAPGPTGDHQHHPVRYRSRRLHRPGRHRPSGQREKLLGPSEAAARSACHHDGPDGPRSAQGSASLSLTSAVSSSTPRAKVSSDTRIWRARWSIRFSPAERPLSLSRMDRFRTTSATW